MKSLEELKAIKEKMKNNVNTRDASEGKVKVVIGMATCGIAAGARPVMTAFIDEVAKRGLDVSVTQTGCIGMCKLEPIVDVFVPGQPAVTYVKMNPEKAVRVVNDHIVNNNVVTEYTIGSAE